jgi:phospholipid/cholesterol/gamma-HCH transport system ATP-binding protein
VSEIAISIQGLVTQFGEQVVHNGLDLDVRHGEILGVVGPSGTGKSVLLREIVGLETPQAGKIHVLGHDLMNASAAERHDLERRWGVMFQEGALFSTLSLLENVALPLREHTDLPEHLIHELARLKLVMAGLEPDQHLKQPSQISGGMRKRAALARAIALDPELLFLDEPTAGLDPVSANRFDALIKELAQAMGLTVFLVTHDLDTLSAVTDRVCVLLNGKVAALAPLADVKANATGWIKDYFSGPRGRAARGAQER